MLPHLHRNRCPISSEYATRKLTDFNQVLVSVPADQREARQAERLMRGRVQPTALQAQGRQAGYFPAI